MPGIGPFPYRSPSGLLTLLRALAFAAAVARPATGTGQYAILATLVLLAIFLRQWAPAASVSRLAIPFLLGLAFAGLHEGSDRSPDLMRAMRLSGFMANATPVVIEGVVRDAATTDRRRALLTVRLNAYRLPGACRREPPNGRPIHLRLAVPLPGVAIAPPWRPGDVISATARLGEPRQFGNPGAFRYAAYLKARDIDLLGSVKSSRLISLRPSARNSIAGLLASARRELVVRLNRAAGARRGRTAAFLSALLVGNRDRLAPALADILQRSGVYHIVALSGLHVGMLALLLGGLLRLVPLRPALRRGAIIVSLGMYVLLVRDSGSIARATLMASLYLLGSILRRRLSPLGVVGVSAAVLLAGRPAWIEDAGFLLSFAATLGVIATIQCRGDRPAPVSFPARIGRRILTSMRMSAGVLLATAPLTASQFHIIVPAALVMNLVAVPLTGLLLMLAILISTVPPNLIMVANHFCRIATELLEFLLWLADLIAALPGAWFHVLPPGPELALALGFTGFLLAAGDRRVRLLALAMILCLSFRLVMAGRAAAPPRGELEVVLLDVGQGDSILLRLPTGLTALIDAGGFAGSSFDVGARVVAPALRTLGLLRLDLLILTHAHADHLGGAASIIREFAPRAIWIGAVPADDAAVQHVMDLAREREIPVVMPRRGIEVSVGGARLQVLNPGGGSDPRRRDGANRGSLALRFVLHDRRALLTGDLEGDSERELLRSGFDLSADLLKVGHHGSRSSSGSDFVRAVAPEIALISVGSTNPWGHPHAEVLQRLRAVGSFVRRTDMDGAVRYRTDGRSPWREVPFNARREICRAPLRTPAE